MKVVIPTIEEVRDLSGLDGIVYTFLTERGTQKLSYREYLADMELREMIMDTTNRYRLILGNMIFSYSFSYLKQKPNTAQIINDLEHAKIQNPLRFFAPSGKSALDFLNDFDNSLCILTAPNRFGKTQTMQIKKLINNMPCDPTWEIFTKYGVKYRPFRGPRELALATYDLPFHRTTSLPMLLNWIPVKELGCYAKTYKGRGAKQVNINNCQLLPLTSGTNIHFTAMSQGQSPFEGNIKHDWGWDEQGSEAAFIGADARIVEILDGRHDFALTPHKIEGRPDTGAGSWINKIFNGENTYGHDIGLHKGTVWDVPDWYYPEEKKVKEFYKWVIEPIKTKNKRREREGDSRFYGNWHESSGLVLADWDSTKHVIEPFEIPSNWTLYRSIDHGTKHPCACLCGAMSPAGDLFIYRDYLRAGRVVTQICDDVIDMCGNKRVRIGDYRNPQTNLLYDRYEERMTKEAFQWTVFDARAFSAKPDGILLSKLYDLAGIKVKQGSGQPSEVYVPILAEWFYVNPDKKHFVTGELGAPRIYIFNTCMDTIRTIKRWVWTERKTKSSDMLAKESPVKKDDDLCDALKLMIQAQPRYRGNVRMSDNKYYSGIYDKDDMDEPERGQKPLDRSCGY